MSMEEARQNLDLIEEIKAWTDELRTERDRYLNALRAASTQLIAELGVYALGSKGLAIIIEALEEKR